MRTAPIHLLAALIAGLLVTGNAQADMPAPEGSLTVYIDEVTEARLTKVMESCSSGSRKDEVCSKQKVKVYHIEGKIQVARNDGTVSSTELAHLDVRFNKDVLYAQKCFRTAKKTKRRNLQMVIYGKGSLLDLTTIAAPSPPIPTGEAPAANVSPGGSDPGVAQTSYEAYFTEISSCEPYTIQITDAVGL